MTERVCYYKLLDIETDAQQDEIKLAYRRQALIWHPDKNSHRVDEATAHFKQLQEAYSVLSDPKERAWYDAHKDQILSGDKSSEIDLWPYFSSSAYPDGFTDNEGGFFNVFDALFDQIGQKENKECESKDRIQVRPRFGNSETDVQEVIAFYRYWDDFVSVRGFYWADLYNPNEAPNRRVRRIIDIENQKARNKERRNYNEQVRSLVDYVRKRDPRWKKYQAELKDIREQKQAEQSQKLEEDRKKFQELRDQHRAEQAKRYAEEYQQMLDEGLIEEEEEKEIEILYCQPCRKKFTNERQWDNHEKSKKHKQMVQKFKKTQQKSQPKKQAPKPQVQDDLLEDIDEFLEENDILNHLNEQQEHHQYDDSPMKNSDDDSPTKMSDDDEEEIDLQKFLLKTTQRPEETIIPQQSKPQEEPQVQTEQPKKSKRRRRNKDKQKVEETEEETKQVGKAKQKREKKKKRTQEDETWKCNTCKQIFSTRNKLFQHLKESKHERRL